MTGPAAGGSAEITQSRGASVSEALAIFKAQVRDYKLHMPKTPRAKIARTAAVLLALAILAQALWMHNVPVPVAIGLFGLLVISTISLLRYGYYWNCAELGGYQANRRFRIEQDALIMTDPFGSFNRCPGAPSPISCRTRACSPSIFRPSTRPAC
jgi:hypothetical protein